MTEKTDKDEQNKKDLDKHITSNMLLPQFMAGMAISKIFPVITTTTGEEWIPDTLTLAEELVKQTNKLKDNDLAMVEKTLLSQIKTLDVVFNKYLMSMDKCTSLQCMKLYADIAMKAQRQCRANAETLSLMKNPLPIQNIKQQNLASQQIVNNGLASPREENLKRSNELLTDKRGEHEILDIRGAATTEPTYQTMEAVGKVDGPKDS